MNEKETNDPVILDSEELEAARELAIQLFRERWDADKYGHNYGILEMADRCAKAGIAILRATKVHAEKAADR